MASPTVDEWAAQLAEKSFASKVLQWGSTMVVMTVVTLGYVSWTVYLVIAGEVGLLLLAARVHDDDDKSETREKIVSTRWVHLRKTGLLILSVPCYLHFLML